MGFALSRIYAQLVAYGTLEVADNRTCAAGRGHEVVGDPRSSLRARSWRSEDCRHVTELGAGLRVEVNRGGAHAAEARQQARLFQHQHATKEGYYRRGLVGNPRSVPQIAIGFRRLDAHSEAIRVALLPVELRVDGLPL
jgi:hypothetical protein